MLQILCHYVPKRNFALGILLFLLFADAVSRSPKLLHKKRNKDLFLNEGELLLAT
jgi:hypothetical protein